LDFYVNDPRVKKNYQAFIFELQKKLSHNYTFRFSYTFSRQKGTANLDSGMMGYGGWDDPNYAFYDYGLTVTKMHHFKFQGIWYAPFGLVFSTAYDGRSGSPYSAYFSYQLDQGSVSFPAEPPSSRRMPFLHYWDVRVGKDFNVGNSKIGLFIDVFNVLNLNQKTSQWTRYAYYSYGQWIQDSRFGETTYIQSPRIAQLGVRIEF